MSQQNKTTLQAAINDQLPDNSTGLISAADVRDNLINITDSLLFNNGDPQTLDGSLIVNGTITGSLYGNAATATTANNATTANFVALIAGQGITVNGMEVTADVRTVNGNAPDGNGNIPLSLGTVVTGTSASLILSSSGAITGSISDATVWIISGDGTPANNGDAYIYKSGSVGQWLTIAPLDEAAGDARYARIGVGSVQSLTSSFAATASYVRGANVSGIVAEAEQADTAYYADGAFNVYSEEVGNNYDYYLLFTDNNDTDNTNVFKNQNFTYNPVEDLLTTTSSYALTASYALNGGTGGSGNGFPYTGSAVISGSLTITGDSLINADYLNAYSTAQTISYPNALCPVPFAGYYDYINGETYYNSFINGNFTFNSFKSLLYTPNINVGYTYDNNTATLNSTPSFVLGVSNQTSASHTVIHGISNIVRGVYSHAEGTQTIAFGQASHTEGFSTLASGSNSHAEGRSTLARGSYSHAEGYAATSFGENSHAEGESTLASGSSSHAEGLNTIARGNYSHAEGRSTTASGSYSHAGGFNTIAVGQYETAIGKFNSSPSIEGAFTVGNGADNNNRSNVLAAYEYNVNIVGTLNISGSIESGRGTIVLPGLLANEYASNAAAAAAGIPLGGLYRNGTTIQIRTV